MANYDKRQLLKTAYNYTQDGQWDRALREYQTISRLFPDDANIHSMVADIFARTGKSEEAVREYLESARIQREAGQDEKELLTLKKILRLFPSHSVATQEVDNNIKRRITHARSFFGQDRLDDAEYICNELLDFDPGNLSVNRLLDDIKAERTKKASQDARLKEEEEARRKMQAAKSDIGEQATREVLSRLEVTADQYLAAGDFDNAIETMLIMLKIDPGMTEVRELLEETQRLLEKRKTAQDVWSSVQSKASPKAAEPLAAAPKAEKPADEKSREDWLRQEQELKSRMEREREAAEKIQKQEQEIIERAVAEMEMHKDGGETPPLPPLPGKEGKPKESAPSPNSLNAKDLMALAQARSNARSAVDARNLAFQLEQDALAQKGKFDGDKPLPKGTPAANEDELRQADNEMLQHAIEMARQEAENKARQDALVELEAKFEQQKKDSEARLREEREKFAEQEKVLRQQMQDLMQKEVAKLTEDIRTKTVEDIKKQLEEEQAAAKKKEEEEKRKQEELEKELREKKELEERLRKEAERKILGERKAIEHLKSYHDSRKSSFAEQAKEKRRAREEGGDEKKKVVRSSKHISDAIRAAATKHIKTDTEAMMETVKNYMKQDLLLDAMKMCQQIIDKDPDNPKVKELLKEIYVRKGL